MTTTHPLFYLLALIPASLLQFSTQVSAQDQESRSIKVKFACVHIEKNTDQLAYHSATNNSFETLQLNIHHLSQPVKINVPPSGIIPLYHPDNLPAKDKPAPPVAKLKLTTTPGKDSLVLLLPAPPESPATYLCKVIPAQDKFTYGTSNIINLTRGDLFILKDGKKPAKKLPRGKSGVIQPGQQSRHAEIQMFTRNQKSKRVSKFYSATWYLNPNVRELCLVYDKTGQKWPHTKVISEQKPAPSSH